MTSRQRRADLGRDDARRLTADLASELRSARLGVGLSQAIAGQAAGMSAAQWGRLERGELARPDLVQLCCAARALGLRGSVRLFPAGDPVHDRPQLILLERVERLLASPLRMRREVLLPGDDSLRAWDGEVTGAEAGPFFVEGESRVGDAQATERRLRRKMRDDPRARVVVLVLARTLHHRRLLADHREVFRELLPLDGPAIAAALRRGRRPPASGILVL